MGVLEFKKTKKWGEKTKKWGEKTKKWGEKKQKSGVKKQKSGVKKQKFQTNLFFYFVFVYNLKKGFFKWLNLFKRKEN
jgi:hypothetical protein